MHPEADAFLDAIFDHPDDDTPRLVYADWLQEHGQESYAQFIRLQCAAAREKPFSDAANRLWEEIGRVWSRLDEKWIPATRDRWLYPVRVLDAVHFHRGFLRDSIPLTYTQLVEYGRTCWPWLPLPFTCVRPDFEAEEEVLRLHRLERIRHLRLADWYDDHQIWPLLDSPRLARLEVLDLAGVVSEGEVEGLLQPGLYPRLREVWLKVYDTDRAVARAGCLPGSDSPGLQELRRRVEARFEKVVWRTVS